MARAHRRRLAEGRRGHPGDRAAADAAKRALPHGEFERMIEGSLPLSASTAQRLMSIARNPVLSDPAHVQLLPPCWGTLYVLSRWPPKFLLAMIADGTIGPHTERHDIPGRDRSGARTVAHDDQLLLFDLHKAQKPIAEQATRIIKLVAAWQAAPETDRLHFLVCTGLFATTQEAARASVEARSIILRARDRASIHSLRRKVQCVPARPAASRGEAPRTTSQAGSRRTTS
jgi:hypothetical protein